MPAFGLTLVDGLARSYRVIACDRCGFARSSSALTEDGYPLDHAYPSGKHCPNF